MPASARVLASAAIPARISAAILLPSRIVAGINLPLTVVADVHFIGKALFATESRRRRRTAKPKTKAYNRKVRKELPLKTAKKTRCSAEAGNENRDACRAFSC